MTTKINVKVLSIYFNLINAMLVTAATETNTASHISDVVSIRYTDAFNLFQKLQTQLLVKNKASVKNI